MSKTDQNENTRAIKEENHPERLSSGWRLPLSPSALRRRRKRARSRSSWRIRIPDAPDRKRRRRLEPNKNVIVSPTPTPTPPTSTTTTITTTTTTTTKIRLRWTISLPAPRHRPPSSSPSQTTTDRVALSAVVPGGEGARVTHKAGPDHWNVWNRSRTIDAYREHIQALTRGGVYRGPHVPVESTVNYGAMKHDNNTRRSDAYDTENDTNDDSSDDNNDDNDDDDDDDYPCLSLSDYISVGETSSQYKIDLVTTYTEAVLLGLHTHAFEKRLKKLFLHETRLESDCRGSRPYRQPAHALAAAGGDPLASRLPVKIIPLSSTQHDSGNSFLSAASRPIATAQARGTNDFSMAFKNVLVPPTLPRFSVNSDINENPFKVILLVNLAEKAVKQTELRLHAYPEAISFLKNQQCPAQKHQWVTVFWIGGFSSERHAMEFYYYWASRTRGTASRISKGVHLYRHFSKSQALTLTLTPFKRPGRREVLQTQTERNELALRPCRQCRIPGCLHLASEWSHLDNTLRQKHLMVLSPYHAMSIGAMYDAYSQYLRSKPSAFGGGGSMPPGFMTKSMSENAEGD